MAIPAFEAHQTSAADKPLKCPYCGDLAPHVGRCPAVRAFEYHPDGTLKRVEFVEPAPFGSGRFYAGSPPSARWQTS